MYAKDYRHTFENQKAPYFLGKGLMLVAGFEPDLQYHIKIGFEPISKLQTKGRTTTPVELAICLPRL